MRSVGKKYAAILVSAALIIGGILPVTAFADESSGYPYDARLSAQYDENASSILLAECYSERRMVYSEGQLALQSEEFTEDDTSCTLSVSASEGGSVLPSGEWANGDTVGPWMIASGAPVSFKIEPNEGYVLSSLSYGNTNALLNGTYDANTRTLTFAVRSNVEVKAVFISQGFSESTRAITIEVQGGHGTTEPTPGRYDVEKGKSYPVVFKADAGYVPYRIWVDGVQSFVSPTLSGWMLPASWSDQTFKIEFALKDEGIGDNPGNSGNINITIENLIYVKDVAQLNVFINGLLSSEMPKVEFNGQAVKPIIVIAPMLSREQIEALDLPAETTDLGIYQYKLTTIDGERPNVVEVVSFGPDGRCLSTNMVAEFSSNESASTFVNRVKEDYRSNFLQGYANGKSAYVQVNMRRSHLDKEGYQAALRNVVDNLELGPVEGEDYVITYSNNDKPGIATATITGKGEYYGVQTVRFAVVEGESDPPLSSAGSGSGIPGESASSSVSFVKTGNSATTQTGNASGSTTGLVKTGDANDRVIAGITVIALLIACCLLRRNRDDVTRMGK